MGNIILKYSSKEELIDFIFDIERGSFITGDDGYDEEDYKERRNQFTEKPLHEIEEYAEKKGYIELTEKQRRLTEWMKKENN